MDNAEEKRKKGPDDDDAADAKRRAIADATTGLPTKPQTESDQLSDSDEECDRLNKFLDDDDDDDGGFVIKFFTFIGDFSVGKFEVYEEGKADATTPLNELLTNVFVADSEPYLRALDSIKKEILSVEQKMSQANYDGRGMKIHAEIEFNEDGKPVSVFVDDYMCL